MNGRTQIPPDGTDRREAIMRYWVLAVLALVATRTLAAQDIVDFTLPPNVGLKFRVAEERVAEAAGKPAGEAEPTPAGR